MPDGTDLGGQTSNLFSSFNARFGSPSVWQNQILKAAQVWAKNTNVNFVVVPDNGAPVGTGLYQQGDPGFGDIRIGGYNFGASTLALAYSPPPINNYSIAGDIHFNTGQTFNVGWTYDLFSVAAHEMGHALGLAHSTSIIACEYPTYTGVKTGVDWDDIYGMRAVYSAGNPRTADYNDATGGNNSFNTATDITQHLLPNLTILRENRDISTTTDVDFFKITAPVGTSSTVQISAQTAGLSLLAPKITVYAADQITVLGSANGAGQYGVSQTVTLTNPVVAGQVIYVKVEGSDTTPFGTGKYAISLSFGGAALPIQLAPITSLANGTPLSGGGGIAEAQSQEYQVNSSAAGDQETSGENRQAVAIDSLGNYVVTWASKDQDGSGWGVYAQRYDAAGAPQGNQFRVNTRTTGDQRFPSVAIAPTGNFVITWSSLDQDGSSWGVYGQRFNAAGTAQGSEFRINGATQYEQMHSSLAIDAYGNFLVAWSHKTSGHWDVFARYYSADGASQTSEFRVNNSNSTDQMNPAVAADANGHFIITWSSFNQDGSGWGIYARRFEVEADDDDWDLDAGNEFRVNATPADDQLLPSAAMGADGDFVITWSSPDDDGSGIFARRFGKYGNAMGTDFRVNTNTLGDQRYSSVAMNPEGDFVITWMGKGLDGFDIFGRQFHEDGDGETEDFSVNVLQTLGDQKHPSLTRDRLGNIVVVWSGPGVDGSADVFAQRYAVGAHGFEPGDGFLPQPTMVPYMRPFTELPAPSLPKTSDQDERSDEHLLNQTEPMPEANPTGASMGPLYRSHMRQAYANILVGWFDPGLYDTAGWNPALTWGG